MRDTCFLYGFSPRRSRRRDAHMPVYIEAQQSSSFCYAKMPPRATFARAQCRLAPVKSGVCVLFAEARAAARSAAAAAAPLRGSAAPSESAIRDADIEAKFTRWLRRCYARLQ